MNCKIPLQKFASTLAPNFVLFQVILRQTKNNGCSEAEQENRIKFHVVKNKKPKEKTKLSYSTCLKAQQTC